MGSRPWRWSCAGMWSGSRPGDQAPRGPSRGCRRSSACSTIRARSCPTTRSSPSSRDACPGYGSGRTGAVWEVLLPAILEQKVTGTEAWRGFRGLVRTHGEPAPGPGGLRVPPSAAVVAGLPYHVFHPFGVERRRAEPSGARARWIRGWKQRSTPPRQATRRPPTGCSVPSRASVRGRPRRSAASVRRSPTR